MNGIPCVVCGEPRIGIFHRRCAEHETDKGRSFCYLCKRTDGKLHDDLIAEHVTPLRGDWICTNTEDRKKLVAAGRYLERKNLAHKAQDMHRRDHNGPAVYPKGGGFEKCSRTACRAIAELLGEEEI